MGLPKKSWIPCHRQNFIRFAEDSGLIGALGKTYVIPKSFAQDLCQESEMLASIQTCHRFQLLDPFAGGKSCSRLLRQTGVDTGRRIEA